MTRHVQDMHRKQAKAVNHIAVLNQPAVVSHPAEFNHQSPVPDTEFERNIFQQLFLD